MRLSLDTHVFLWEVTGDRRLPDQVRDVIGDSGFEELPVTAAHTAAVDDAVRRYPGVRLLPAG